MGNLLFSIVIPCYNCESTIEKTVYSVLEQSFNSVEIILVEDCSSDNTKLVLEKLKNENPEIIIVYNSTNVGPGGSRNNGINVSRGKYICFLDSDDLYAPNLLSTIESHIIHTNSDLILFEIERRFRNGGVQRLHTISKFNEHTTKEEYIANTSGSVCSIVAKRELYKKIKFPNTYLAEDVVIVPLLCLMASNISSIHIVGYYYNFMPASLSRNNNARMLDSIIQASELLDEYIEEGEYVEPFVCRKVRLICYNYVYTALRNKNVPEQNIANKVDEVMSNCPDWINNKYLTCLPFRKRLFIKLVNRKQYRLLKLFLRIQNAYFLLKQNRLDKFI